MPFVDQDALAHRATLAPGLARLQQVRVTIDATVSPPQALLDVKFWTPDPVLAIAMDPRPPAEVFPILGGHRVPAGSAPGMVQVVSIAVTAAPDTLRLVVAPVGDYSTYSLTLDSSPQDPLFASIDFKFRPGCFFVDCAPEWPRPPEPIAAPAFDTLARDYDSFRHVLITAMQQRVAGWQPTSDADLSVTLLDLFAAAADELADYQDRVMNEAYLATARNRVSVARHARLVDYHVHQGNQASTMLALHVAASVPTFPKGMVVRTNDPDATAGTTFVTTEAVPLLNGIDKISLYTWDNTRRELAKGDTSADLHFFDLAGANAAITRWTTGALPRLLIAEEKNPLTGGAAGRNPDKRQVLRVTKAELVGDPLHPTEAIVRVTWHPDDALAFDYCFVEKLPDGSLVTDICRFHGNLVAATAGAPVERTFVVGEPTRWGTLCALPEDLPLLYLNTPPDGVTAPVSTLEVTVTDSSNHPETYYERISLVHSGPRDRDFAVETDELRRSFIRFGNGTN
ncbi:MAG TPA: hypothetical protein VL326_04540, partial [Kofleriaceae bacterium]|nr:hypothetical protein [Kofleriaceae bacterium]